MSFCDDAWDAITPIRQAIDKLPFLTGLSDGNLPRQSFTYYMAQDAHYLQDFGRILAMAAGQAGDPDELLFWINSARSAVLVERQLHATHVADFDAAPRSPTGTAYTSFLLSLTTVGCHPRWSRASCRASGSTRTSAAGSKPTSPISPPIPTATGSPPTATRLRRRDPRRQDDRGSTGRRIKPRHHPAHAPSVRHRLPLRTAVLGRRLAPRDLASLNQDKIGRRALAGGG